MRNVPLETFPEKAGAARKGILVTGTDTGAGKTYVSCLLGASLRRMGFSVRPFKPVESGCDPGADGSPIPTDARSLRDAIAPDMPLSAVCLYALPLPLSPHQAARAEGITIDTGRILAEVATAAEKSDFVLVEGVGGIAVEIREGYTFCELARDAGLSLLVVAENRLGVLNHLKLTLRFLQSEGLPPVGVVVNDRSAGPFPAREPNEEEVRRIAGERYLGRVPHGVRILPAGILSGLLGILGVPTRISPDNPL